MSIDSTTLRQCPDFLLLQLGDAGINQPTGLTWHITHPQAQVLRIDMIEK